MWWSRGALAAIGASSMRRSGRARRFAAAVCVAAAAAAAAGCGFRPLYGGADGAEVAAALASVEVLPVDGPLGFEMRNHLVERLATGLARAARYELAVRIGYRATAQITEKNTQIRRHLLNLDAGWSLASREDGSEVAAGRVFAETSYNIVADEDYSTLVAQRDAADRAAREAAWEIAARLAIHFDSAGRE